MFIPHTACISVQALKRGTSVCQIPKEGLRDFSMLVPCRYFPSYMRVGGDPAYTQCYGISAPVIPVISIMSYPVICILAMALPQTLPLKQ